MPPVEEPAAVTGTAMEVAEEEPVFPPKLAPGVQGLELKSPVGGQSMFYTWPLKKGRGSVRKSEDKHDEAAEIIETIRWICEDVPEVNAAMDNAHFHAQNDLESYETMAAVCDRFNKAVEKCAKRSSASTSHVASDRVCVAHLKHIITKCYNRSVIDPNKLNRYEAFTPEVYGETSFELISQILEKLHPIGPENKFIDLGSGVGHVVLQVAALSECEFSLGIEKADIPAKYATYMEQWFKFWMNFYGKKYSPFKLIHGDFLDPELRPDILKSTILLANNFAFGPQLDEKLKSIFADLNDGARIFASKSFCPGNFRMSNRKLGDIGTIMYVSMMDPLVGSVSWTPKPVSYYLHVIDRAKLERYFQSRSNRDDEGCSRRGSGFRSRGGSHPPTGCSSSRSRSLQASSNENSLTETPAKIDDNSSGSSDDKKESDTTDDKNQETVGGGCSKGSSVRPMRAAAVTAAAIQEAQQGHGGDEEKNNRKSKKGRTKRNLDKDRNERVAASITGLDLLHDVTLKGLEASHNDRTAPAGCVNERLSRLAPSRMEAFEHEETHTLLMYTDGEKEHIPHQLQVLLQRTKQMYLRLMDRMRSEEFKRQTEEQLEEEQRRKTQLETRKQQLTTQIDNLIDDSLAVLHKRLDELGIEAKSHPEFLETARGIVRSHHQLQKNKHALESEVRKLENEQERMRSSKENDLVQQLSRERPDWSPSYVRDVVRRELDQRVLLALENNNNVNNNNNNNSNNKLSSSVVLPKLSSDVTLTKCGNGSLQHEVSTQLRKRPREPAQKQRDWPEKRSSPEHERQLANAGKRLITMDVNSSLENTDYLLQSAQRPTSAATLIISPTKKASRILRPAQKTEPISPPAVRSVHNRPMMVDLPKVDLSPVMAASSAAHQSNHIKEELPPRPPSDGGNSSRVANTTPRAEQFEDRLKTIIHSVLNNKNEGEANANNNAPSFNQGSMGSNTRSIPMSSVRPQSSRPRASDIIEASIRGRRTMPNVGGPSTNTSKSVSNELEGLACPRSATRSPDSSHRNISESVQPTSSSSAVSSSNVTTTRATSSFGYPAMEGLAARFGPFMEQQQQLDRSQQQKSVSKRTHGEGGSVQDPQQQVPPSKRLQTTENRDEGLDGRHQGSTKKEWQDTISSGFDRLVAYAMEVDKRRKSSDSNSPKSSTQMPDESPRSSSDNPPIQQQQHFDNRVSTLSMKFKGAVAKF